MTTSPAPKKTPATKTTARKTTASKTTASKTTAPRRRRPSVRGVAAVRAKLAANQIPIVVVGPTPYNLSGLERWLGGLRYVTSHDPFDGTHPALFTPASTDTPYGGVEITNHLLADAEVRDHLATVEAESGGKPKITTVYADAETERLCTELGYDLIIPTQADRERVIAVAETFVDGDEKETTGGPVISLGAVVTRHGTVVGSAVSSLVGDRELGLDPYAWYGAETHPGLLSATRRTAAVRLLTALGQQLDEAGFRGYLEAELRVDDVTDEVGLTGVRPGIGAATALVTTSAGAYADLPLYALHVLEHLGIDYDLDVAELTARAGDLAVVDAQAQLVITETAPVAELIMDAPVTGRYVIDETGRAHLVERSLDWHGLSEASEFYLLRLAGPGDPRWLGSELAVVITRGRARTADSAVLTSRARTMIDNVRAGFLGSSAYPLHSLVW